MVVLTCQSFITHARVATVEMLESTVGVALRGHPFPSEKIFVDSCTTRIYDAPR
jgi:hypothetical protein